MSILKDPDHQALHISIGRVLELYLNGDIDQNTAKADLSAFFANPDQPVPANDIHVYIHRILDMAKGGKIDSTRATSDLVAAAVAAKKPGPQLGDLIHLGTD